MLSTLAKPVSRAPAPKPVIPFRKPSHSPPGGVVGVKQWYALDPRFGLEDDRGSRADELGGEAPGGWGRASALSN